MNIFITMTITLEIIVQELQRVPVNRLKEVYHLIHKLAATRPLRNEDIIEQTRELTESFDDWSVEEWVVFNDDLNQTRSELFNRSEPEL